MIDVIELEDAVNELSNKDYGIHYLVIYPDLITLREFYSYYIQKNIEEKNQIVQIAPFYETEDSVRQTLSEGHREIKDLEQFEKERTLIIVDSLKKYQQDKDIKSIYNNSKRLVELSKAIKKDGVSVLGDLGAFLFKNKTKDLIEYDLFLPTEYKSMDIKGICLYHKDDFNKLTQEQKQNLAKHHGKAIEIIPY